jgi:hypothetical protein
MMCIIYVPAIALAHGHHHHRHHCGDCHEALRTISGTVAEVNQSAGGSLEATLNTATGVWRIRLGDAEHLRSENLRLEPGDVITVTGSPVNSRGTSVLLAGEIRRGEQRVTVRASRGCGPCAY